MPVAATEKVALCPAVTVWLVGCAMIDGATRTALVLPLTNPVHPELKLTINAANKTVAQRFIACLSDLIFPGEACGETHLELARGVKVLVILGLL